jgi:hypothetical protein
VAGSCTQEIWCRFKHPIGDFPRPTMSDLGDEEEDFSDVPDVRDVQPHMKRPRELHPKYKSTLCVSAAAHPADCPHSSPLP